MAFRDKFGQVMQSIPGLLYPGYGVSGDPAAARAAQAQALMQMGAGLIGGQDFGQAYGGGLIGGNRAIDQWQQQQYMKQRALEWQQDMDWRAERAKVEDADRALSRKHQNRTRMLGRMKDEAELELARKRLELQELQARTSAGNMASDNARQMELLQLQRAAEARAQEEAARQRAAAGREQQYMFGAYPERKGRGGGPGQKRVGGQFENLPREQQIEYLTTGRLPQRSSSNIWDALEGGGMGAAGAGGLPQVRTEEEYMQLPSGATYIAPDGTTRRKP